MPSGVIRRAAGANTSASTAPPAAPVRWRRDDGGQRQRQAGERFSAIGHVGADHGVLHMGEIGEAQDRVGQRDADRDDRDLAGVDERVDEDLDHGRSAREAMVAARRGRASARPCRAHGPDWRSGPASTSSVATVSSLPSLYSMMVDRRIDALAALIPLDLAGRAVIAFHGRGQRGLRSPPGRSPACCMAAASSIIAS